MDDPNGEKRLIKPPPTEATAVRELNLVTKNKTPISIEVNPALHRLKILRGRLGENGSSPKDDFQALHLGDYARLVQVIISANPNERVEIIKTHLREEEQLLAKVISEGSADNIITKLSELPDPRCSVASKNITEILTHLSVLYELQEANPNQYLPLLEKMQAEVFSYLRASQQAIDTKLAKNQGVGSLKSLPAREQLQSIASADNSKYDKKTLGDLLTRLKAEYPDEPAHVGTIGRQGEQVPVEITFEEWNNLYYLSKAAAERFQQVTAKSPNFMQFRELIDSIRINDPKIYAIKWFQGSLVIEDATIVKPEMRSDKSGKIIAVPSDIFKLYKIYMDINSMNDSITDAYNKPLSSPKHRGNAHNAFGAPADKFAKRITNLVNFIEEK